MIPQIASMVDEQIEITAYPSFTYKLEELFILGTVDGLQAVRQAIFHILSTERYAYAIYDHDYGVELEQYIGNSFEYLEETIQKTIEDALLQDDRITGVDVLSVEKLDIDAAQITIAVDTSYGYTTLEVDVPYV